MDTILRSFGIQANNILSLDFKKDQKNRRNTRKSQKKDTLFTCHIYEYTLFFRIQYLIFSLIILPQIAALFLSLGADFSQVVEFPCFLLL